MNRISAFLSGETVARLVDSWLERKLEPMRRKKAIELGIQDAYSMFLGRFSGERAASAKALFAAKDERHLCLDVDHQ